jgi:activating signal cointegrator complex subunit 2
MKRLEAKYSSFAGAQKELGGTAWKASPQDSGTGDSDVDGNNRGRVGEIKKCEGRGTLRWRDGEGG